MATDNMPTLHICTPETCPEGANYFVTLRNGDRYYYMAGPYYTHQAALDAAETARKSGAKAWFYSWGTSKSDRSAPGSIAAAGLL